MKVLFPKVFFKVVVFYLVATQVPTTCLFEDALNLINSFHRVKPRQNKEALLTESPLLTKIAQNMLSDNGEGEDLDANGSRMVLYRFYPISNEEPGVGNALSAVIHKLAQYVGLETWCHSQNQHKNITIKQDPEDILVEEPNLIGSGTQGKIYRGKVAGLEGHFAIKTGATEELHKEANSYSEIKPHDGLLNLFKHGVFADDPGKYALVLELMFTNMQDLLLLCGKKFSLKTSIIITRKLLEVAKYIHDMKHVHRDLKLENIIMNTSNFTDYVFKIGDLGAAEKFPATDQNKNAPVGSPITMSTFAHDGQPASPRDDLMSIWFIFGKMVFGSQPWSDLSDEVELILKNKELTNDDYARMYALLREIGKLKTSRGKDLAVNYPELQEFVDHAYDLQINRVPDYDMLEKCLTRLMENQRIVDDGKVDWDIRLRMLLKNPDVVKVGIGSANHEHGISFIFVFEKFYATLTRQIEEKGKIVDVIDGLNYVAKRILSDGGDAGPNNLFKLEVHENKIEDILLGNFTHSELITTMIQENPILLAGFAYSYDAGVYTVVMILNSILDPNVCMPTPLSQAMMVEANQYLYSSPAQNNSSNSTRPEELLNPYIPKLSLKYPSGDVLISTLNETLGQVEPFAMKGPHLLEYGYAFKQSGTGVHKKVEIVYAIRRDFNFSQSFFKQANDKELNKLSFSVDESPYHVENPHHLENPVESFSSSSSSKNAGKQPLTSESKSASSIPLFSSKQIPIEADCPSAAVDEAIQITLNNLEKNTPYNIRVQWKMDSYGKTYTVSIIQDSYYSFAKATYENLNKQNHHERDVSYWKLSDHKAEFIKSANDYGFEKDFFENKIVEIPHDEDRGMLGYVTRIPFGIGSTMDQMIQRTILFLIQSNEMLKKYNPRYMSSISFGYAITVSGAVKGVLLVETYCYEALDIINRARVDMDMEELALHPSNYELAEAYRSEYVGWKGNFKRGIASERKRPLTKERFVNQTAKEVLTSVVNRCLAKGKGEKYQTVTYKEATMISFVVFQSKKGGKWKINISIY